MGVKPETTCLYTIIIHIEMDTYDLFQKLSAGAKFKKKALPKKSEVLHVCMTMSGNVCSTFERVVFRI